MYLLWRNHFGSSFMNFFGHINQIIWFKVCHLSFKSKLFNYSMCEFFIWTDFRNLRLLIGLGLLDTSLPQNDIAVTKIKHEAKRSGLLETFLESVPEFIFQCSIIMRTGIISTFQVYWTFYFFILLLSIVYNENKKTFFHLKNRLLLTVYLDKNNTIITNSLGPGS